MFAAVRSGNRRIVANETYGRGRGVWFHRIVDRCRGDGTLFELWEGDPERILELLKVQRRVQRG